MQHKEKKLICMAHTKYYNKGPIYNKRMVDGRRYTYTNIDFKNQTNYGFSLYF